jgi:hypothetical protein
VILMSNVNKWDLNEFEIAYYYPKHGRANKPSLKVQIPKIMPLIFNGTTVNASQDNKRIGLNSSCFCNASNCKPSPSGSINMQNYMVVPLKHGVVFENDHFYRNDKLRVEIQNGNVYSMVITGELDPSHKYDDCKKEVSE